MSTMEHEAAIKRGVLAAVVLAASAAAMAVAAAPLLVYTVSLAALGLPHVVAELRYVDIRFRARLTRPLLGGLAGLLAVLVVARLAGLCGLPGVERAPIELLVLVGLCAITLPTLAASGPAPLALGVLVLCLTGLGCLSAPVATLVVLAVLHNLTPVGFLAENLRGTARRRALTACAIAFGVIPTALLLGFPQSLLAGLGWTGSPLALIGAGDLPQHIGSFVPGPWLDAPFASNLFVAAVYLQVLHYAVVIHVLPKLLAPEDAAQATGRWPTGRAFPRLLAAIGAITLVGFAISFGDARRAYGVFAAVHAWVEIPLLLLALTPLTARARRRTA